MNVIQIRDDDILLVRQFDPWNSAHKTVLAPEMLQGRKGFERQLVIFQRNYYLWFGSA